MIPTGGAAQYFPFLRGRQNELVAVQQLAAGGRTVDEIVPIIEPVSYRGLGKALHAWNDSQRDLILVVNPRVRLRESVLLDYVRAADELPLMDNRIRAGILLSRSTSLRRIAKLLERYDAYRPVAIHLQAHSRESAVAKLLRRSVRLHVYHQGQTPPGYHDAFDGDHVLLLDGFERRARNGDYPEVSDFESAISTYRRDGFSGFGDFTIVGDTAGKKGGAPPRHVVVHLTYFDSHSRLRVRHLRSRNATDVATARMFRDALEQLPTFLQTVPASTRTPAVREFLTFLAGQHFPGLGPVKGLSILHHAQLLAAHLARRS